jgi:hypothetical protein
MGNIKWTKEKCYEEALKYNTKKDFELQNKRAYSAAYRHKWLDEICLHMKIVGNRMFRCIYVYEFSDNYAYIGLTYNLQKRNISRRLQNNDAVTKHINNTNLQPILKQLSNYIRVDIAVDLEIECIKFYKENGWNILNIAKGGQIGTINKLWTKEMCYKEALKYNNKTDFYNYSNSAHAAACRYGWLNEICSHMIVKNKHWTIENCKNEALKYKTKNQFIIHNKAAYTWALRHNILNEISSHMKKTNKKPCNYWIYEKCKEIAMNCQSKTEFNRKYSGAYDKAYNNNWLNDFFN